MIPGWQQYSFDNDTLVGTLVCLIWWWAFKPGSSVPVFTGARAATDSRAKRELRLSSEWVFPFSEGWAVERYLIVKNTNALLFWVVDLRGYWQSHCMRIDHVNVQGHRKRVWLWCLWFVCFCSLPSVLFAFCLSFVVVFVFDLASGKGVWVYSRELLILALFFSFSFFLFWACYL